VLPSEGLSWDLIPCEDEPRTGVAAVSGLSTSRLTMANRYSRSPRSLLNFVPRNQRLHFLRPLASTTPLPLLSIIHSRPNKEHLPCLLCKNRKQPHSSASLRTTPSTATRPLCCQQLFLSNSQPRLLLLLVR